MTGLLETVRYSAVESGATAALSPVAVLGALVGVVFPVRELFKSGEGSTRGALLVRLGKLIPDQYRGGYYRLQYLCAEYLGHGFLPHAE